MWHLSDAKSWRKRQRMFLRMVGEYGFWSFIYHQVQSWDGTTVQLLVFYFRLDQGLLSSALGSVFDSVDQDQNVKESQVMLYLIGISCYKCQRYRSSYLQIKLAWNISSWLINWLIDWSIDWLIDWLIDWFIDQSTDRSSMYLMIDLSFLFDRLISKVIDFFHCFFAFFWDFFLLKFSDNCSGCSFN